MFWPESGQEQLKKQFKNPLYRLRMDVGMDTILYHQPTQLLHIDQAALVLGSPPEKAFELRYSWGVWGKQHITAEILTNPPLVDQLNVGVRLDEKHLPEHWKEFSVYGFPVAAHK